MDEVTQQNAALVEEAAAAAESMQEQAGNLVQTVAQFRLVPGESGPGNAGRRSPPRAQNVTRLPEKTRAEQQPVRPSRKKAAVAGGEWEEF
ncbi:MAG: hypothetical protein K2W84_16930, partial [Burkholderiales bacterium]|nr:hypothetical protein [Burkholderiales bacterium]